MGDVPTVALRDGNLMPQLGFGTGQIPASECPRVLGQAIAAGYRAFDTAQCFGNEDGVGQAIRESGLPRGAFFITSKLRNGAHRRDDVGRQRRFPRARDTGLRRIDPVQPRPFVRRRPRRRLDQPGDPCVKPVRFRRSGH